MRRPARMGVVVLVGLAGLGAGFGSRRSAHFRAASLGSGIYPAYPAIAVDGSLGFDAVWAGGAIMTSHWSAATRKWTKALALSARGVGQSVPQVASSPSGAAAVIWTVESSGAAQTVGASYRGSASGVWQRPVTIFHSRTESVYSPQLGIDNHGNAFAVWRTVSGAIQLAEHSAGVGSWSPPVTVVQDARAGSFGFRGGPVLAVSPAGTLALVWEHELSGSVMTPTRGLTYLKVRPAGRAAWLPTLSLGAEGMYTLQGDADIFVPSPRVAINRSGSVFVTWQWPHKHTLYPRAAILTPASGWRKPRSVALPTPGIDPVIAGDDRGFATVLWEGPNGIEQADLSPGARVPGSRALPGGRYGVYPELAANGHGTLAATWGFSHAATRPAGHKWCPPINLTEAPPDAQVAIAPSGTAQVVWEHTFGKHLQPTIVARTMTPCIPH